MLSWSATQHKTAAKSGKSQQSQQSQKVLTVASVLAGGPQAFAGQGGLCDSADVFVLLGRAPFAVAGNRLTRFAGRELPIRAGRKRSILGDRVQNDEPLALAVATPDVLTVLPCLDPGLVRGVVLVDIGFCAQQSTHNSVT